MLAISILFSMSILFVFLSVHPFLTYGISLRIIKRLRHLHFTPRKSNGSSPSFAICVSAYNEEAVIEKKIENLLAIQRATPAVCELLLYIDAASDRTADIARAYRDRIRVVEATERRGKSAGMNRLAEMATAEILVFSDANVMVSTDALVRLIPYFGDPSVGCVCGNLTYVNSELSATASVGSSYWQSEEHLKQHESDTGGVIGADGSIFAMRRELHRPVPEDLIDDFYLSLALLCEGHKVVRAPDFTAIEGSTVESIDEFKRKIRIACQAFNVHRHMARHINKMPLLLLYKYYSHKFLRWFSLINLSIGLLLFVVGMMVWLGLDPAFLTFSLIALGFALIMSADLPLLDHPLMMKLREVLFALVATSMGVGRSLKGERFQTWHPPVSRAVRATNS